MGSQGTSMPFAHRVPNAQILTKGRGTKNNVHFVAEFTERNSGSRVMYPVMRNAGVYRDPQELFRPAGGLLSQIRQGNHGPPARSRIGGESG
jgi:hypothetical protein